MKINAGPICKPNIRPEVDRIWENQISPIKLSTFVTRLIGGKSRREKSIGTVKWLANATNFLDTKEE